MTVLSSNKRLLKGVKATPTLSALYQDCLLYCHDSKPPLTTISTDDDDSEGKTKGDNSSSTTAVKDGPSSVSKRLLRPLSLEEAVSTVLEFEEKTKKSSSNSPESLPIAVLRAMHVILGASPSPATANSNKLNDALSDKTATTQLVFTTPSTETSLTPQQEQFQARMERLRLQSEATQYCHLTNNIDANRRHHQEDDVTTKSMTYAASVGLNMIVAPLSFGVFMYFFSGPLLNTMLTEFVPSHPGAVDIRKVMIGVMSGVGMLFVEMMLFVIRTHEFERGMRRKQHKQQTKGGMGGVSVSSTPFGEYSSATEKTYRSGVGNSEKMPATSSGDNASRGTKKKDQ